MTMILHPDIASAVTNKGLKLIINSSEQCNLRCVYCYESFTRGHLQPDVAEGVIRLIENRVEAGLQWLDLEFFGGEPLGAWNVVKELTGKISDICDRNNVEMHGGVTTNATLLHADRFDWLVRHGITGYQITLDGPREIHDTRRISLAKAGSFDTIWQRLLMIKASKHEGIEVVLRMHFDATSAAMLIEPDGIIDAVINTFLLGDKRFRIHFNPLQKWGGGKVKDIEFFVSSRESRVALESLLGHVARSGIGPDQVPQLNDGAELGESGHAVCYAARSNAFIIRSDGAVSKCSVAFDNDRNIVGKLSKGGELTIDHELHKGWIRGLVSGDASELACPAKGHVWPAQQFPGWS